MMRDCALVVAAYEFQLGESANITVLMEMHKREGDAHDPSRLVTFTINCLLIDVTAAPFGVRF